MPKIISKTTVHFRLPATDTKPEQEHIVKVSPDPQEVPAWVVKTDHFALLKKDGSVIETEGLPGAPGSAPTLEQLKALPQDVLIQLEEDVETELDRRAAEKKAAAKAEADAKKAAAAAAK